MGTAVPLLDENGAATAITAKLVNGTAPWGNDVLTGQEGAYAPTILNEGARDYLYIANGNASLRFAGLDNSKLYTLRMGGSVDRSGPYDYYLRLNGVPADGWAASDAFMPYDHGYVAGQVVSWENALPVNGELVVEVAFDS